MFKGEMLLNLGWSLNLVLVLACWSQLLRLIVWSYSFLRIPLLWYNEQLQKSFNNVAMKDIVQDMQDKHKFNL